MYVPNFQALIILKTGFLFVAAEFGNHRLYQFLSIKGSGDEDTVCCLLSALGVACLFWSLCVAPSATVSTLLHPHALGRISQGMRMLLTLTRDAFPEGCIGMVPLLRGALTWGGGCEWLLRE